MLIQIAGIDHLEAVYLSHLLPYLHSSSLNPITPDGDRILSSPVPTELLTGTPYFQLSLLLTNVSLTAVINTLGRSQPVDEFFAHTTDLIPSSKLH